MWSMPIVHPYPTSRKQARAHDLTRAHPTAGPAWFQKASEIHRVRFANVLSKIGVRKGTPVAIYMGMVPELPAAMLA